MASVDESPRSSDERFFTPRLTARTGGYASSDGDEAKFVTPRGQTDRSGTSQSEGEVSFCDDRKRHSEGVWAAASDRLCCRAGGLE